MPLVDKGDPGEGIVLSLEGFEALCADQLAAPIDRTSDLLLQFADDADAEAIAAELAEMGVLVDRRYVPTDVNALKDLRLVPVAVGLAVMGLGLVAVAHALVLAVRRRRRDLGVLRALGLRPGEASSTVRWQAATIATVAVTAGIPAGLVAGRALWLAIARPIHVLLEVDVPTVGDRRCRLRRSRRRRHPVARSRAPAPRGSPRPRSCGASDGHGVAVGSRRVAAPVGVAGAAGAPDRARRRGDDRGRGRRPPGRHGVRALRRRDGRARRPGRRLRQPRLVVT